MAELLHHLTDQGLKQQVRFLLLLFQLNFAIILFSAFINRYLRMPNYKLYYFGVRGRGELARLILNCAGVPFEDYRFSSNEWPTIKPSNLLISHRTVT